MTKPNFRTITLKEFREYLKVNRTDDEAWDIFFDRLDKEGQRSCLYPPITSPEQFEQLLQDNPEVRAKFGV